MKRRRTTPTAISPQRRQPPGRPVLAFGSMLATDRA
jgi:hypothetical protein